MLRVSQAIYNKRRLALNFGVPSPPVHSIPFPFRAPKPQSQDSTVEETARYQSDGMVLRVLYTTGCAAKLAAYSLISHNEIDGLRYLGRMMLGNELRGVRGTVLNLKAGKLLYSTRQD